MNTKSFRNHNKMKLIRKLFSSLIFMSMNPLLRPALCGKVVAAKSTPTDNCCSHELLQQLSPFLNPVIKSEER